MSSLRGRMKKAPGLLNSNANHFFNTRRENSRDRGQMPSVSSSLFFYVFKNDWHCKDIKFWLYESD